MSNARLLPWALVAVLAACTPERAPPQIRRVVPGQVLQSSGGVVAIEGEGFFADLHDPFWSSASAAVNGDFRVWIGDTELTGAALRAFRVDQLEVELPVGLPLGDHAVRVRTPAGAEATLQSAVSVVDTANLAVFVEDSADGLGQPITARQLVAGGPPLTVHAILRGATTGRFIRAASSTWSLTSDLGELVVDASGASAAFTARAAGTTRITATPVAEGAAGSSGDLTVVLPSLDLAFATAALQLEAGACSPPIQVALRDASGNAFAAPEDLPLTVSAPGAALTVSSSSDCTSPGATPTLLRGQSTVTFHLRGTLAGAFTLTAASGSFGSATQALTVAPAPASTFAWSAIAPVRSGLPFPVTVQARDGYGNVATGFASTATLALLGGGSVACATGCSSASETAAFSAGAWSGTLTLTASTAGPRTLAATRDAVSGNSSPFSVVATRSPPTVRVHGSPVILHVDGSVALDASASSDYQSPPSALQYSFDFSGGTTAPPWTPWSSSPALTQTFSTEGYQTARVAVRDGDGDIGYGTLLVLVLRPQEKICVVDDPSATLDDGATSCTVKGPGGRLSLTEAFRIAGGGNGNKGIVIGPGVRVSGPANFTIAGDWWVMASPEDHAILDGVHFTVPVDQSLIIAGLELTAPGATLATVQAGGFLALENTRAYDFARIDAPGTVWTYRAVLTGCTEACIRNTAATSFTYLRYTTIADSAVGVLASTCANNNVSLDVASAVFTRNQVGIRTGAACGETRLVNATFHGNVTGLEVESGTHTVRNVVFSSNGTALRCLGAPAITETASLLHANTSDGCAGAGTGVLRDDPLFLLPEADDFRLDLSSPGTDTGVAPGVDINDIAPGLFTGAAADRGGREAW